MENKIRCVTSVNQQGTKNFTVGVNNVELIKDNSKEFENSIEFIFDAFDKDGKLIGSFINGALVVDYF